MPSLCVDTNASSLEVTIGEIGLHSVFTDDVEYTIDVRCVRWELHALSEEDRKTYFDTLAILYNVEDETGRELYGPQFKSIDWLVREHLYGADRCMGTLNASFSTRVT